MFSKTPEVDHCCIPLFWCLHFFLGSSQEIRDLLSFSKVCKIIGRRHERCGFPVLLPMICPEEPLSRAPFLWDTGTLPRLLGGVGSRVGTVPWSVVCSLQCLVMCAQDWCFCSKNLPF